MKFRSGFVVYGFIYASGIILNNIYPILPNTRASPNRCAPKFFDHVPEVSSPKIYMTTLFNDRLNPVLTICLLHSMK